MQTVVETPSFLAAAKQAGLSDEDRFKIVSEIAANPVLGDLVEGSGGVRKFRFAGRGKGKSGGFRIISLYVGPDIPVFLLTVFGKGEKANLTKAERNDLAVLAKQLAEAYRNRVAKLGGAR